MDEAALPYRGVAAPKTVEALIRRRTIRRPLQGVVRYKVPPTLGRCRRTPVRDILLESGIAEV